MQIVAKNLILKRRFVRVCLPGARSPENWRPAGLPQGRGAPRSRRAPDALVRSTYTVRPSNGRPDKPEMRLTFSKSARARAIACARVALRVCDVFIRCLSRRPSYLKFYFKSKDPFRERASACMPGAGLVPLPWGSPAGPQCVGDFALVACTRVVYMALCVVKLFPAYRLSFAVGIC